MRQTFCTKVALTDTVVWCKSNSDRLVRREPEEPHRVQMTALCLALASSVPTAGTREELYIGLWFEAATKSLSKNLYQQVNPTTEC